MAYPGTVEVVTFTIEEGDPVGGTIVATVRDPTDTEITYTYGVDAQLTKTGTGVYVLTVPCPTAGTWRARLVADGGTLRGAEETEWKIAKSAFV